MTNPTLTLDLGGEKPLVTIDDQAVAGVVRVDVEVTPDALPTLVLRVVAFRLIGGDLPKVPNFGGLVRVHRDDRSE
ncbi:hypothetical protein AWB80_02865 [Caballeronia pedi]|uniref:Uncharacterized protein n=1 Tax=Caballeronia pedi TaxID=1777141 RepID=A0A158B035_9BURK|nr:hypothetical protein [Caballeronia pedi]SAK63432.1 hypothetical protein AWB80_02865 [Caballeronia pedi]